MAEEHCSKCWRGSSTLLKLNPCNLCNKSFHEVCLGVKSERVPYLLSRHTCNECDQLVRIRALEQVVSVLRYELEVMSSPIMWESLTYEAAERIKRANNVIVYNFPESQMDNVDGQREDDKFHIIREFSLFRIVNIADPANITVQRLRSLTSPRPLKVCFRDDTDTEAIIKKSIKCGSKIRIHPERTYMQQRLYRQAKAEMGRIRAQGCTNKKIIYVKDIPVIVDVRPEAI